MKALALACLSAPALACPSAEDLARGVAFITDRGFLEVHVARGEGLVETERLTQSGGATGTSSTALYGLYLLASETDGLSFRYTWPAGIDALPYPQLGLSEEIALITEQDEFPFPGIFQVSAGETPIQSRFGDCTLETWGIATEVTLEEETGYATFFHWYPALGTGVPVRWSENGEETGRQSIMGLDW
ncbi:MAG: hypothetical protein AAFR53_04715 [Pseudomonadota bacterium]